MKRCYEIRYCPASCYLSCSAYSNNTDCWNTIDIPCCKRDNKERCLKCKIYQNAKEDEKEVVKTNY